MQKRIPSQILMFVTQFSSLPHAKQQKKKKKKLDENKVW